MKKINGKGIIISYFLKNNADTLSIKQFNEIVSDIGNKYKECYVPFYNDDLYSFISMSGDYFTIKDNIIIKNKKNISSFFWMIDSDEVMDVIGITKEDIENYKKDITDDELISDYLFDNPNFSKWLKSKELSIIRISDINKTVINNYDNHGYQLVMCDINSQQTVCQLVGYELAVCDYYYTVIDITGKRYSILVNSVDSIKFLSDILSKEEYKLLVDDWNDKNKKPLDMYCAI